MRIFPDVKEVDLKLIELARSLQGKIVTNDFNLNKVAQLRGVEVLNINELANSLKPVVLPGETMKVFILKEGKEYNQGVAYLDDGTMVVVDNARSMIGKTIDVGRDERAADDRGQDDLRPLHRRHAPADADRSRCRPACAARQLSFPPFHWWRTVFFLIPAISVYTIVLGTLSILSTFVDRKGHAAHWCARAWSWLILATTGVEVHVQGLERVRRGETYVFISNHQSIYDIPVIFASLPFQLRIIAKESLGRFPFLGWHLIRAGHLLVDRRNPDRSGILKRWRRLVSDRLSLIIFPRAREAPTATSTVSKREASCWRWKPG
jgi:1-acyl-sn-glycerol-3-phosphate acyltransferase